MAILNLKQVAETEWEFDYYGNHYVYYVDPKDPYTECYTANEQGIWIEPYLCYWRKEQLFPDQNNPEERIHWFLTQGKVRDEDRKHPEIHTHEGVGMVYNQYKSTNVPTTYWSGYIQRILRQIPNPFRRNK